MSPSPTDRMPPIPRELMTEAQRAAADALIAGPRKAVKGPFVPLLRSPELMARLQRVGEYLRFGSALPPRLSEFATLVVARQWTQQFEWAVHVPLAMAAGTSPATIDSLHEGARPATMDDDEALVYDLVTELVDRKGLADAIYGAAVDRLGEHGLLDLIGLVGYFTTISMVLNVARTPAGDVNGVTSLPAGA
ncbi:MAG: carboxymuconolactone decarboxylase family protein [Caldimonas sp.]